MGFFIIKWFIAVASLGFGITQQSEKKAVPNIIVILTDDQGYGDLSCHGSPDVQTPNLDGLFDESVRFTDFHVSPTCAPSRAALLTGKYPFRNGISHTKYDRERLALESVTIADRLKEKGYETGIFGKWHLGDEPEYQPGKRGFDEVFIHGGGGIGQDLPYTCADVPNNSYFDPVIKQNGTFMQTKGFCTDVFFREALGWIKKQSEDDQPFFAWIATNAPHAPFIAPEKWKEKFKKAGYPEDAQGFYGMIENIDYNMGILLERIEAYGIEDNTVVIFMSDNGKSYKRDKQNPETTYNAGMKGFKTTPHRGGTRVPFFFKWPEVTKPGGTDIEVLAAHIDLYPTLCDVAGIEQKGEWQYQGRSLMPLIRNQPEPWGPRKIFFHVARWKPDQDFRNFKYKRFAVRNDRFRLISGDELYDIKKDPGQEKNVIEEYPQVTSDMMKAYEAWWEEMVPYLLNEGRGPAEEKPFPAQYRKQLKEHGIPDWDKPDI